MNFSPRRGNAARLEAGKRPATVNRELAALRRMFSLAVRAGKLAGPPPITLLAEDKVDRALDPPAVVAQISPAGSVLDPRQEWPEKNTSALRVSTFAVPLMAINDAGQLRESILRPLVTAIRQGTQP
jgi:hypothetical protein